MTTELLMKGMSGYRESTKYPKYEASLPSGFAGPAIGDGDHFRSAFP